MSKDYKYSIEYRERFGFNGAELYWMEEAFKLFSEKATEEIENEEKAGRRLIYTASFFPAVFEDIMSKAKQWSNPPKVYEDD
jgi:hypothetical protein